MFEVFFDIPAQDFMMKADENTHSRAREILEELAFDPVPLGAKRIIESQEKVFRYRSRHLRLLYRVDYEKLTLVVITIEPLSRMYR
ncbi:MAG: type II toxin-antitoxin system RelE/ParE family toxin [Methanosarcina sp.]|uniref:type II toxin-antitoxin system RelE family toxin n=1 Tax=Methanosarcina sp. TaxID=2213 RepID=UPI00260C3FBD|nr:type II toxin-antitoxin system RelE/ParE family toxin [Methanosarcina sp.]MDD3247459.1 type II toxin-antitoxin system RelE/ParE family toxin [Methanosarcina sp.]MDD4250453.1 type II toxin-antitoxin system RelE/ParE family toxin [Methanosarcina sp.]